MHVDRRFCLDERKNAPEPGGFNGSFYTTDGQSHTRLSEDPELTARIRSIFFEALGRIETEIREAVACKSPTR